MLARAQQLIVISWCFGTMTWVLWSLDAGRPGWTVFGFVLACVTHPALLALEFMLMHRVNRDDPAPRASTSQLMSAWWGEVLGATQVFGWRQPFRSEVVANHLPVQRFGAPRRGVVLIHGYVCNRGLWNPWLERLTTDGRAFIAVNLEPVMGSIEDYVTTVDNAVRRVTASTGVSPIIVAHSMGGLVLRRWWSEPGNDDRVHHAITIGTPHQGTWLARFAVSTNARQMRRSSRWLESLQSREAPDLGRRMTCFYGHCDNIVFPASTAIFPGAKARHLAAVAHVHMVEHPEPWDELQRHLQD